MMKIFIVIFYSLICFCAIWIFLKNFAVLSKYPNSVIVNKKIKLPLVLLFVSIIGVVVIFFIS